MTDNAYQWRVGDWLVGGASVIGPSHIRRQLPNQDAYHTGPATGHGPVISGALADGHGAATHYRSDSGAKLAVETATDVLDWSLEDNENVDLSQLCDQMIEAWRNGVQKDAAQHPFEDASTDIYMPYGCTLLSAIATSESVCLTQLGDGDILIGFKSGEIMRPMAEDSGLHGEETYSLCLEDPKSHFKTWFAHRHWEDEIPDFILMATDGVSKSFTSDDAFTRIASEYRERCLHSHEKFESTLAALPEWLSELATKGAGDDASMILAVRNTQ